MTAYFCPDCTWTQVPPPRRGKDGRCGPCRSLVGHRQHSATRDRGRYLADADELRARYLGRDA